MAGRITRKELKTDKFAVEVEHTVDYVSKHRQQLVLYASIAAAVAVIAVAAYFYVRHQHGVREQALADAIQIQEAPVSPPKPGSPITFPTEDAKRAAANQAFSSMASKYSGSNEAAIAKYYMGAIAVDQGKMADAAKLFQDAGETGDSSYGSLARFSLAQVHFATGRTADGEKILRDLMDHPTAFVSKEQATISLARGIVPTRPAEARKLLEPLRAAPGVVSQMAITALGEIPGQ